MKHLLLTAITAVVLVGCGNSEADRELFDAASYGNIINGTAAGGVIEAVKGFLAAGTDVNAKDTGGETTLYHAATKEIAELLIANGAGVNAKDEDGRTPLHEAHSKEIAELLIAEGADVNAKSEDDFRGTTPLDAAISFRQTETEDFLRKHGGKTRRELKARNFDAFKK